MIPLKRKQVDLEKSTSDAEPEELEWHAMSKEEAFAFLDLDNDIRHRGLTAVEAQNRLVKYGPNKFSETEQKTIWQKIWSQLCNFMVGILAFVGVVSLIKGITAHESESRITNLIEFGLVTFVIA
jgi:magnesium-transporting ATPase (P-type)